MKLSKKSWKLIKWVLAVMFFGAVGWLLYSRGREMDWGEVWASVRAFDALTLATGLGFTLLAYLAFGTYDLLSKRHLKHDVPAPRVLTIAMASYALNLNLGALVGGWAARIRLYSRVGVDAAMSAQIIGMGLLSNWTGYVLIAGLVFTISPPELPETWALSSSMLPFIGGALLLLLSAYLLVCALKPGHVWKIRSFELRAPTLRFAGLQLGVSAVHWLSTCMVISSFLPGELAFTTVLGVLVMSSIAGAAAHIPAGLGVIEAVFVAALGDRFPPAQLLGALLAYRATFYLAPLLVALIAYPFLEMRGRARQGEALPEPRWAQG
ncbi:MAG: lysylphosphatidylglycerol synthase domain-containing protein [Panacagrimonas sp.]